MKLLPKQEADSRIKKENEELLDTNIRLHKHYKSITTKLDRLKDDYTPEKLKALKEFEDFVKEVSSKKSKLLKELRDLEQRIEDRKDVYYGLVIKQDALEEKLYEMREKESNLELRERFVVELEKKQRTN